MTQELNDRVISRKHVRIKEITGAAAASTLVSILAAAVSPSFMEPRKSHLLFIALSAAFALILPGLPSRPIRVDVGMVFVFCSFEPIGRILVRQEPVPHYYIIALVLVVAAAFLLRSNIKPEGPYRGDLFTNLPSFTEMVFTMVVERNNKVKLMFNLGQIGRHQAQNIVENDGFLGNQGIKVLIRHSRAHSMSLSRNIHRGIFGKLTIGTIPALLVLSSLLLAQSVTLEFPRALSARQCSIGAGSTHTQIQRFDTDGLQWIAPVAAFVILPSVEGANCVLTQEPLPAIETKGFHFNRPPPTN